MIGHPDLCAFAFLVGIEEAFGPRVLVDVVAVEGEAAGLVEAFRPCLALEDIARCTAASIAATRRPADA